jgi:fermentation-respiration switch protein FrsA (DUF1100 family)
MGEVSKPDYSKFDRPEILMCLFHPRPEWQSPESDKGEDDLLIPVDRDVAVGARFHAAGESCPSILFFHGNGEIVSDYDDLGTLYTARDINFLPVDYRGYGRSTGKPTVSSMMKDCHTIFDYIRNWLQKRGFSGPLVVMGRSLGSASALEISRHYGDFIDALIVESGFAYVRPLFELLGIDMDALGIKEEKGFNNIDKISAFKKPTLIIHAEHDHIIALNEGKALFEACTSLNKRMLMIPGANHNDIFLVGIREYMDAVSSFMKGLSG